MTLPLSYLPISSAPRRAVLNVALDYGGHPNGSPPHCEDPPRDKVWICSQTNFSGRCYLWPCFLRHLKCSARTPMSYCLTRTSHSAKASISISIIHLSGQSQNTNTSVSSLRPLGRSQKNPEVVLRTRIRGLVPTSPTHSRRPPSAHSIDLSRIWFRPPSVAIDLTSRVGLIMMLFII